MTMIIIIIQQGNYMELFNKTIEIIKTIKDSGTFKLLKSDSEVIQLAVINLQRSNVIKSIEHVENQSITFILNY